MSRLGLYARGPNHGTEGRQAQLYDSVFHNSTFHIPHAERRRRGAPGRQTTMGPHTVKGTGSLEAAPCKSKCALPQHKDPRPLERAYSLLYFCT